MAPKFRIQDFYFKGASLSSSAIGELYASGGLLVVLFGGWAYGWLGRRAAALLDPRYGESGAVLYACWLMALFAGCRSMMDLVMMSYIVLAMLVILWFVRTRGHDIPGHQTRRPAPAPCAPTR